MRSSERSSISGRTTTSGQILKRLDIGRLPASQRYKRHDRRWKRYEKQLPGHRVQIDVKFIEPLASMPQGRRGGRNTYYQFTAIDDCTRLRVLKIYPTLNQTTAIQFVDHVLQRLPFQVEVIQTDNGGSNALTVSTARSSTGSWRASSSTTPTSSTTSCANGRTTTTTIAPTAARLLMNASSRRPHPGRKRSPSVAQRLGRVAQ
ncbi:hypothetical protein ACGH7X_41765 [Streptomyces sp. BBFR51]|uniref:hypothetical protein n=1 Tax=Streptomyces sp. BBFR51 TaxID=3372856 RepID=UPI0037DCDB76